MEIVEFLAAFYGLVILFGCVHVAGQWIASRLEHWQHRRIIG